jgi:MFS family permease
MSVMDLFIVNVALHTIGSHLHSSLSDVAWVLNAYALFFGALLIPAGRFSDKIGRKAVFMLGLAIFTIASLACALSPDLWVLIAFRCVQAIGEAMLIPSSLGLVLTAPAGASDPQCAASATRRRGRPAVQIRRR